MGISSRLDRRPAPSSDEMRTAGLSVDPAEGIPLCVASIEIGSVRAGVQPVRRTRAFEAEPAGQLPFRVTIQVMRTRLTRSGR
jgi:hypothetical protein